MGKTKYKEVSITRGRVIRKSLGKLCLVFFNVNGKIKIRTEDEALWEAGIYKKYLLTVLL